MAIKKPKNQVNFLGSTEVQKLQVEEPQVQETVEKVPENSSSPSSETTVKKHKDINNWGRPRKLLIEGVAEKRISVDVPETLLKELKRLMKKEGKSMKELLITPAIREYMNTKEE